MNVEFAHEVELVGLDGFEADAENGGSLFYGVALGQQLHYFALAAGEGISTHGDRSRGAECCVVAEA